MYKIFVVLILFSSSPVFTQNDSIVEKEISINTLIDGTLVLPKTKAKSLAIIIAGSGPIDRNGNQNFLKNNALKKLAEGLTLNGIATFRYDKRIVKQIQQGNVDPNIKFDDFVTDAISVVEYFKTSKEFSKIYVLGHSQGSLVGMLSAKDRADGFISLAGAGQNIGDVIVEQVSKTAPGLAEDSKKVVDILKTGETTDNFPPVLASLFRKDLQPFMINWMSYEPTLLIKDLQIPILLINGTKDLQVSVAEAKLLKAANIKAELAIINDMNHVLFIIKGGNLENSKSYNESFRPISEELVKVISTFINK
ncbi:alpha/beta hydrolase [Ichthyenterobacterium sp. W332]|uniref:Alpha/beta hydrolase n=1 Tax=Microcosmobacter mediterraneus TaxID=3075607 RepID=A0ABU2YN76_9FLAO|nr:alpha/beta hydrolase [Ichthyenterobacterium sp. W332]MDT0559277.1 alpha/beta hydrolase [Ichthyenterobacterium sp. W332]